MLRLNVEAHDASHAKLLGRLDECSGAAGRLDYHALG